MPIILIRTYEARCDGDCCLAAEGCQLDADEMLSDAIHLGWLQRGRKLYCPECRPKHEPKPRSKP
jgi:hypothetical protein